MHVVSGRQALGVSLFDQAWTCQYVYLISPVPVIIIIVIYPHSTCPILRLAPSQHIKKWRQVNNQEAYTVPETHLDKNTTYRIATVQQTKALSIVGQAAYSAAGQETWRNTQ